jgi:hypothetical protein
MKVTLTIAAYSLLSGLSKDTPYFLPRLIGILLGSSILGFLIGSAILIIIVGIIRSNRDSGEFPIKKVMIVGGVAGALVANTSLLILMF